MVENTEIKELERLGWQLSWCIFNNEVERKEKTESEEAVRIRHKVINMAGRGWRREVYLPRVGAHQRQFKGRSGWSCEHGPNSMGERFETTCAVFEVKATTRARPPQLNSSHLSKTFFFFFKITVFCRRLLLRKGFPYKWMNEQKQPLSGMGSPQITWNEK